MNRSLPGGDRVTTVARGDEVEVRCNGCGRAEQHAAQPAGRLLDELQAFIESHAACDALTA